MAFPFYRVEGRISDQIKSTLCQTIKNKIKTKQKNLPEEQWKRVEVHHHLPSTNLHLHLHHDHHQWLQRQVYAVTHAVVVVCFVVVVVDVVDIHENDSVVYPETFL